MSIYLYLVFSTFIFTILENFTNVTKKVYFKCIQYFYVFVLFILFAFNRDNADYRNYQSIFNGTYGVVKEKGYIFFNNLIKKCGGNYNFVLLILGILVILVIFKLYGVKKKITLIFIYAIHNMIFDIIQVRNLYCVLFILIGIKYLQKRKDKIYLFYNFLAITFQKIGYIYIIFYIFNKFKLRTYIKILLFSFLISIISKDFLNLIANNFFPEKAYYFQNTIRKGILIYYCLFIIDVFVVFYINYKKKISCEEEVYIKFILFPIIFLPFGGYFFILIERLWRNTFLLKLLYCLNLSKIKKKKLKYIILILLIQQIFFLSIRLWRAPEVIMRLFREMGNIQFYF